MPIYSARCQKCGDEKDYFSRIDDRDISLPECCGSAMGRFITPTMVNIPQDFGYKCTMSGETVTSYKRRQYLMEKNGVVDARGYESHWKATAKARAAEKAEVAAQMAAIPDAVKKAALAPAI